MPSILRAIAFACNLSVTDPALRQIGLYRLKSDPDLVLDFGGDGGFEAEGLDPGVRPPERG